MALPIGWKSRAMTDQDYACDWIRDRLLELWAEMDTGRTHGEREIRQELERLGSARISLVRSDRIRELIRDRLQEMRPDKNRKEGR